MRTAGPRRALTATRPRRAAPTPLTRAAAPVDRWGLVAGMTGFVANILLAVLVTTRADGPSVPMPTSLIRDITYGAGLLTGIPVALASPVWLIVLSYQAARPPG